MNRISTLSGSSGARRTEIPPCARSLRTWKRVTGTVDSSRSITCTPLRLRPAMIARLSARAIRLVSRLTHTTEPFLSAVPSAMARRLADVAVVVHHGAFEMRVGFHDHVGPEDCVRREHGPRFHTGVVTDEDRAFEDRVG